MHDARLLKTAGRQNQVGPWGRRIRSAFDCYLQGDPLCALALYAQVSPLPGTPANRWTLQLWVLVFNAFPDLKLPRIMPVYRSLTANITNYTLLLGL